MNAQLIQACQAFNADTDREAEYVAANLGRIEKKLAENVATSCEAASAAMCDLAVRLALSVPDDDAELGRVFRAAFWKAIREMAKWRAEDEFHTQNEMPRGLGYNGPRPANPVSQEDSGE